MDAEEDEVDKLGKYHINWNKLVLLIFLDVIIENSGCAKELEQSKECYFDHKDWRKCRDTTQKLKECMERVRGF